jgi:hypothetical protein
VTVRRKTGSVYALGMRVVRLGPTGAPLVGPANAYATDNLVKLDFTMNYRDGDTKERTNGAGKTCLYYAAPPTVRDLTINSLELCNNDATLEQMLGGGDVIADDDDDPVGYAAPEVGSDPSGDGLALELWSAAMHDEGYDDAFPYERWLFPRESLRQSGTRSISSDPMAVAFEGTGRQNSGYGAGPFVDPWPYISSRVFQHYRVATIPDLSVNGPIAVPAPAP